MPKSPLEMLRIKATAGSNIKIKFHRPTIIVGPEKVRKRTESEASTSSSKEEDDIIQEGSSPTSGKVFHKDAEVEQLKKGLRELAEMQLSKGGTSAFRTLIFIMDKYVVLGDDEGYIETRQKLEQLITEIPSIDASFALAAQYIKEGKEFEMILMCKAVVTWYKYHALAGADGKKSMTKIVEECIFSAKNAAIKILSEGEQEKQVYHPFLTTLMHEMLSDLKWIEISDKKFKVGMETLASYYIMCVHYSLQEWRQMYDISYTAVAEMRRVCGNNSKKYLAYGDALFMAAMAKYHLHSLSEAENLWIQAKEVYAAGGRSQEQRFTDDWIEIVQRNIHDNDLVK